MEAHTHTPLRELLLLPPEPCEEKKHHISSPPSLISLGLLTASPLITVAGVIALPETTTEEAAPQVR